MGIKSHGSAHEIFSWEEMYKHSNRSKNGNRQKRVIWETK